MHVDARSGKQGRERNPISMVATKAEVKYKLQHPCSRHARIFRWQKIEVLIWLTCVFLGSSIIPHAPHAVIFRGKSPADFDSANQKVAGALKYGKVGGQID